MMCARLISWKGPDDLVEAVNYLPKNVHAVLVGWGPLEQRLRSISKKGGFKNRLHLLGSRNDVPELLNIADVYAQTHKYSKKGDIWIGPNTSQMEACAAGVPSVSTKVPLIESLIEDKVTGLLAEPNNPRDIARSVRYLIDNPQKAEGYAREARRRVESKYSIGAMIAAHEGLYKALTDAKRV